MPGWASGERFGVGREKLWAEDITCDGEIWGGRYIGHKSVQGQEIAAGSLKHRGKQRSFGSRCPPWGARERVHGGSQGRAEGQSPQPGRRGAGRPPVHPAPWWRGAGSEVFPGHQATRVSPGGCNSS